MGVRAFAMILTALVLSAGAGAGVWMSAVHPAGSSREEARSDERLLALREALERALWIRLEALQTQARLLLEAGAPEAAAGNWPAPDLIAVAEFGAAGQGGSEPLRTFRNPRAPASFTPAEQERIWKEALTRIRPGSGDAAAPLKGVRVGQAWVIALASHPAERGGRQSLAVIDLGKAGGIFEALGASVSIRAYLADLDGHVLAHSNKNYIGLELGGVAAFRDGSARAGREGEPVVLSTLAIDGVPVRLSAVRLAGLGGYLMVEEVRLPEEQRWQGVVRALAGLLAALALAALLLARILRRPRAEATSAEPSEGPSEGPSAGASLGASDDLEPAPAPAQRAAAGASVAGSPAARVGDVVVPVGPLPGEALKLQALREEMEVYRQQIRRLREQEDKIAAFEKDALALRDPRKLAGRLSEVASSLCGSSTLVLLHDERMRSLVAAADAGFEAGRSPVGLSCSVSLELLCRVERDFVRGELIDLRHYDPLRQAILLRTGVAHFDAWAVAGFGPLGRAAGRCRLLGCLVVLQSGVDSFVHREQLGRMIRAAGLVYENALLAANLR